MERADIPEILAGYTQGYSAGSPIVLMTGTPIRYHGIQHFRDIPRTAM
jgi:hypothetical protein